MSRMKDKNRKLLRCDGELKTPEMDIANRGSDE